MAARYREAEFKVPAREASGLDSGQWVWRIGGWRGVRSARLSCLLGDGYFTVTAAPRVLRHIRRWCRARHYREG